MRYDAEQKDRTRERVLTVAARTLKTVGPEALGVANVMKAAGLTHGGFYAHFPSKDALILEALERAFDDSAALYRRAMQGRSPREALHAFIAAYVSTAHRDTPSSGCVLPALSADLPRMAAGVRERFAVGVQRLTTRLSGLMREADIPQTQVLASSIVAEMVGAVALARAVGAGPQSDDILRASREALISRLALEEAP